MLPQWNYLHLHDEVLPYIQAAGVTQDQIAQMLIANPRRIFESLADAEIAAFSASRT